MSISNLNNALLTAYLNPLSTISNTGQYGRIGNPYQTSTSFYSLLQSQQANQMKQEIYRRFRINVGGYSDTFSCYIPSEVLCKMNTDKTFAWLLYQKYLMQQAALMPYGTNLYSGYNNLYGLSGINSFCMMQNPLFSSMLGGLF